jgi:uncharacterized caspase-like protein
MVKIALLVGVSKYEEGLEALPSASKDIEALREVLVNPEIGDFAAADVMVLSNPSRQEMEDAIYGLFANRQKDDLALLYFSGHGILDESSRFYFASSRTRKVQGKLIPTTALEASAVQRYMEESRSQRQVVILDSCFSGAFAKGVSAKDSGSVNLEQFLGGKGRAILTASTSTQYALTQNGFDLSIYTHFLVEGLRTGGADIKGEGWISPEDLHVYTSTKVREAAPAMTPEFYPVKGGYTIRLAKSPKDDPALKYRKEVQKRVHEGTFSIPARRLLNSLRGQLNLKVEVAETIETEVLRPHQEYRRKLKDYEETLKETVQSEPTLTERTKQDLNDFQQHLGLRDDDIADIQIKYLPTSKNVKTEIHEIRNNKQLPENFTFEKFTEKGIKTMMLAQEESRRLGHNFVGPEQILLGLIREGTGVAAKTLKLHGVNIQNVRVEVEKIIGRGSGFVASEIPFTPRAKKILYCAWEEARQLNHDYLSTEHLLLGILEEGAITTLENQGVAIRVLILLGINLEKLKSYTLKLISGNQ